MKYQKEFELKCQAAKENAHQNVNAKKMHHDQFYGGSLKSSHSGVS